MSSMQVLVYDDSYEVAKGLASKIQDAYDNVNVATVSPDSFRDSISQINARRTAWRTNSNEGTSIETIEADEADIVVADYDLLTYSESGDITGSRLAYLLRCFTKCGLIVVLNEYGTNAFDASLRNPSLGFGDLYLGAAQIGNFGLWTEVFEGYRPWHWPVLPQARENFEKCVEDVQGNLDQPILDFLGLGRFVDWMPRRVHEFLLGDTDMESIRLRTFVEQTRGGIESKDKLPSEYMARVAAARLISLMNDLVLSEQSLLVDAPHLVSRFPSLVRGDDLDIHHWNDLCEPLNDEIDDLLEDCLIEHRFAEERQHWLWRPAWYWPDVARDERIAEVSDPWTVKDVGWVFCENISRFIPEELADDFRADVSPPFDKRFVLKRESPEVSAFVGNVGSGGIRDPLNVEYVPQAAFSI